MIRMIRKSELEKLLGLKHTTLYRHIQLGILTQGVRIGPQSVAWPDHEISAITQARIAGRDDEAIRALVAELHAARQVPA